MRVNWLVCALIVGCSSSEDTSGTYATGYACGAEGDRVCCQMDNYVPSRCIGGVVRCPSDFPNFIPSAACDARWYPGDTGIDVDAGDARGPCTSSPSFTCFAGAAGRACSDIGQSPICQYGGVTGWACPEGTVEASQCGCSAGPPGPGLPPRLPGDACSSSDAGTDASDATFSDTTSEAGDASDGG